MSDEHKRKIGLANKGKGPGLGHEVSTETKSKISKALKGRIINEEWRKKMSESHIGYKPSEETRRKLSEIGKRRKLSEEAKRKLSESHKGEKNPRWRGGITSERNKIYNSQNWKIWRLSVFERDGFVCQLCKEKGGKLEAHHIKKWSKYPDLIFEISNGITLCVSCHNLTKRKEEKFEVLFFEILKINLSLN